VTRSLGPGDPMLSGALVGQGEGPSPGSTPVRKGSTTVRKPASSVLHSPGGKIAA